MSKYALIFSSHLTQRHVADQLMVMGHGYNYIEGEPCVSVDMGDIEVYGRVASVKVNNELIAQIPSHRLHSAECYILPASFLASNIGATEQEVVYLNIPYEMSIKTDVTTTESGFKCFGSIEVRT